VEQAKLYAQQGVQSLSVLTEQDNFDGSLEDLVRVKNAFPRLSVLRKDFLLDAQDIDASLARRAAARCSS